MIDGKPVSIWNCTTCGVEGRGEVYITNLSNEPEFECWEPEGWLLTTKEVRCTKCESELA